MNVNYHCDTFLCVLHLQRLFGRAEVELQLDIVGAELDSGGSESFRKRPADRLRPAC